MIIKKHNTPGRGPFIGQTEFYAKRLLDDAVRLQTQCLIVLDWLALHGASQSRWAGNQKIAKGCVLP